MLLDQPGDGATNGGLMGMQNAWLGALLESVLACKKHCDDLFLGLDRCLHEMLEST